MAAVALAGLLALAGCLGGGPPPGPGPSSSGGAPTGTLPPAPEVVRLDDGDCAARLGYPAGVPDGAQRRYDWSVDGRNHSFTFHVPQRAYDEALADLHPQQPLDYGLVVHEQRGDPWLAVLACALAAAAVEPTPAAQADMVRGFVQSLAFGWDAAHGRGEEYPTYPAETLWGLEGDCDDRAILMATLLEPLGIGGVLVLLTAPPPQWAAHMGYGIPAELAGDAPAWTQDGRRYAYVDSTDVWPIGDVPPRYDGWAAELVPVGPRPALHVDAQREPLPDGRLRLHLTVTNVGSLPAHGVSVDAGWPGRDAEAGQAVGDLAAGQAARVSLTVGASAEGGRAVVRVVAQDALPVVQGVGEAPGAGPAAGWGEGALPACPPEGTPR